MQALRACGAFVVFVSGDGAPDLLVHYRGIWTPLEVKSAKGKIRAKQQAAGYPIVRNEVEALEALGAMRVEAVATVLDLAARHERSRTRRSKRLGPATAPARAS